MKEIELIIKIPEEIRLALINNVQLSIDQQSICDSCIKQAIVNGTPLPKGHGRLIDADALGEKLHRYTEAPYQYALTVFNELPTIIDADGGDAK